MTLKRINKQFCLAAGLTLILSLFTACGGGGGGSAPSSGGSGTSSQPNSSDIVRFPYETVYGDICTNSQPTPGCTFSRKTGQRITVSADPSYNSKGFGTDDLYYVKFDANGTASVYDDLGSFKYFASTNQFAGYISGTTIGVGTTGAFWENVTAKNYWLGKNGVLYSANTSASNYGNAINNKDANKASDGNSKALKSEDNVKLIKAGAEKLVKSYGLSPDKAVAVASALNSWAVMGAERGKVTESDMDKTFKTVFGVQFNEALASFKDFSNGDVSSARELTNRSAAALGLKPDQAQEFIKGMYKGALTQWGYDVNQVKW